MIASLISDREFLVNENILVMTEVAKVIHEVVFGDALFDRESPYTYKYVEALAFLKSADGHDKIPGYVELVNTLNSTLSKLASYLGLLSTEELFAFYFDQLLLVITSTMKEWTRYSSERKLLNVILLDTGSFVGTKLDSILQVFKYVASPTIEFEISQDVFILLNRLMASPSTTLNSAGKIGSYSETILNDILLNNLVWKPGRKAISLRNLVANLFLKFVSTESHLDNVGLLDKIMVQTMFEKKILPNVVSVLEEDHFETRKITLQIINAFFNSKIQLEGILVHLIISHNDQTSLSRANQTLG